MMKLMDLPTSKIIEVNESYGARLYEQGRARLPSKQEIKAEAAKEGDPSKEAVKPMVKPARKK